MPEAAVERTRAALEEERDFLLRSLRDLDAEHDAGDLDEADHARLHRDYTARAAAVIRRIDALDAPPDEPAPVADEEALDPSEATTGSPLRDAAPESPRDPAGAARPAASPGRRRRWPLLAAVGVVVAAGLAWAIVAATGNRAAGGVATGAQVGQEQEASLLAAAQAASAKGDGVTALKDLQAVLALDPNQVEALAAEGWILAQTQQPALLSQGIGLLTRAIDLQPDYPPARVYRGVAYLSEEDYTAAVIDLQYYLDHGPDQALVARVDAALAQARAGAAKAARGAPTTTAAPAG